MDADLKQLLERFASEHDLIEAVKRQHIVQGDQALAEAILKASKLVGFEGGQAIIRQGAFDQAVYLLLAGKVSLNINNCTFPYGRGPGDVLGEISAINPELPRTATVQAEEPAAALQIERTDLLQLGRDHPELWRLLAVELTRKLEQRNQFVDSTNKTPRVFIISTRERKDFAKEIRIGLSHDGFDIIFWGDDQIFSPGGYPLDDLRTQVALADFGIALAHPDDIRRSRKRQTGVPRDNVIFEIGYFMSVLGRSRTFVLVPEYEKVDLPSDFKGLTPLCYKEPAVGVPLSSTLGPTVDRLAKRIKELGPRSKLEPAC